jgi:PKD repeat protein
MARRRIPLGVEQLESRLVPSGGLSVSAGLPVSGREGSPIYFTGTAAGGQGALTYSWNWGDGSSSTGSLTPNHSYQDDGSYTATLTVSDAYGDVASSSTAVTVRTTPPAVDALGPYTGKAGSPVTFAGLATDRASAEIDQGFQYLWSFGDGTVANTATAQHSYTNAGTYAVTLTVTDADGVSTAVSTTATIARGSPGGTPSDYQLDASALQQGVVYSQLSNPLEAADGAYGMNALWEQGKSSSWSIGEQRYGEQLVIAGVEHSSTSAINAGLKMFDWGFAHQATDGSFAGSVNDFSSTAFFTEAVAHAMLVLQQSPYASQYATKINSYKTPLDNAAQWMTGTNTWAQGTYDDAPYTHRRYLDAAALGLTSLFTGDTSLMADARSEISDGLSLQWSNGVNPELGGYDSSYQTVGLSYAELWVNYFPNDTLTPSVTAMINKGLAWEETMILSNGQVSIQGDTRTGVEIGPSGNVKGVDAMNVVNAFSYWYQLTGTMRAEQDAQRVAAFYFIYY